METRNENGDAICGADVVVIFFIVAFVVSIVGNLVQFILGERQEARDAMATVILLSESQQPWTSTRLEEIARQHQLIAISVFPDFKSAAVIETVKHERILLVLPLSPAKPRGVLVIRRYDKEDVRAEYEIGNISYYQLADRNQLLKNPVDLVVKVP